MMQDYVHVDILAELSSEKPSRAPVDIATMPIEEKILKVISTMNPGSVLATREREMVSSY